MLVISAFFLLLISTMTTATMDTTTKNVENTSTENSGSKRSNFVKLVMAQLKNRRRRRNTISVGGKDCSSDLQACMGMFDDLDFCCIMFCPSNTCR